MVRTSFSEKLVTGIFVLAPVIAFVLGIILLWNRGVNLVLSVTLLVAFFIITGLGITAGFHRLFTHASFKTYPIVKYILAVMGMLAVEMPLFKWVANHRVHHKHSDKEKDPHSPHSHGGGCWGIVRGFFHAHAGWFFQKKIDPATLVRDLARDRVLVKLNSLFPLWVVLGFLLPALIAFLVTGSLWAAFLGFLWGGLIRMFFVHHVTWSINSVCHIWGYRRFDTSDESRNNPVLGLLAFGEGWHNNHHADQRWARHGIYWYEVDFTWYVIWILKKLRLAWDIRVPTREEISRLRGKHRIA
jgi:stearoyl-CoA desaturase (delta-9 desaturase)